MTPNLCGLPNYWIAIVWVLWLCFETWLGITKKVTANSTLELIFGILIAAMWAVIQHPWKGKP